MGRARKRARKAPEEPANFCYAEGHTDAVLTEADGAPAPADTNALVLPARKKDSATTKEPQQKQEEAEPRLSKSAQKRLAREREKREKAKERAEVIAALQEKQLAAPHVALIRTAATMGQRETTKQKLRRALLEERAGISQSDPTVALVREVERPHVPFMEQRNAAGGTVLYTEARGASASGLQWVKKSRPRALRRKKQLGSEDRGSEEQRAAFAAASAPRGAADAFAPTGVEANHSNIINASDGSSGLSSVSAELVPEENKGQARKGMKCPAPAAARSPEKPDGNATSTHRHPDTTTEPAQDLQRSESGESASSGSDSEDSDAESGPESDGASSGLDTSAPEPGTRMQTLLEGVKGITNNYVSETDIHGQDATARALPSRFVMRIRRSAEVEEARSQLPVVREEHTVMEAILAHDVVVICGETGSGKTTQVPQFLYEYGFGSAKDRRGRIAITQPRRVAAVAMAARVQDELGENHAKFVAHHVRFDSTVDSSSRIVFMTDGVLLREIQSDLLLRKYSVIVLDEAHERNLNTDILIGLLSRAVALRRKRERPLKLVIMSATLRVEDFTDNKRLFAVPPPVVHIAARTYPVSVHFNRTTPLDDYFHAVYEKTVKIHQKLPTGGILVFMTGRDEIDAMCARLEERFSARSLQNKRERRQIRRERAAAARAGSSNSASRSDATNVEKRNNRETDSPRISDTDSDHAAKRSGGALQKEDEKVSDGALEEFFSGDAAEMEGYVPAFSEQYSSERRDSGRNTGASDPENGSSSDGEASDGGGTSEEEDESLFGPMHVLPLYAVLAPSLQRRVFQSPPPGHRLVVVATNVAETSLTIPNISYVVDCGRAKRRVYTPRTGVSSYEVSWISKASADQRAGRAGRTGPGHCYRLYSSAVFQREFEQFEPPEIQRVPLDGLVLQLRAMGIAAVSRFPFPSPPPPDELKAATRALQCLQCLAGEEDTLYVTDAGKRLARIPISPRFGRVLAVCASTGILPYGLAAVSVLSVGSPIDPRILAAYTKEGNASSGDSGSSSSSSDEETAELLSASDRRDRLRDLWRDSRSELIGDVKALGAFLFERDRSKDLRSESLGSWCKSHGLRLKTLREAAQLVEQLANACELAGLRGGADAIRQLRRPLDDARADTLCRALTAGLVDRIARRRGAHYYMCDRGEDCAVAGGGVSGGAVQRCAVHRSSPLSDAEYVAFADVVLSRRNEVAFLRGCTRVDPKWIFEYARGTPLMTGETIVEDPPPSYSATRDAVIARVRARFGNYQWELPPAKIPLRESDRVVYRYFAYAILVGKVIPSLKDCAEALKTKPDTVIKHATSSKKAVQLISSLKQCGICSRQSLVKRLHEDASFLRAEIIAFFSPGAHARVREALQAAESAAS